MIETGLVYIHATKPTRRFVGCGTLVEGDKYIATCRHVWREATNAAAKVDPAAPLDVEVEFPYSFGNGAPLRYPALLLDDCKPGAGEPEVDLVLLQASKLPAGVLVLQPAAHEQFETGAGYVIAGLIRDPDRPGVVSVDRLDGSIASFRRPDGRRQFTGTNPTAYWSERGSSGSPVFRDGGQQLAGVLSLSELGANAGNSHLHEAFIVPATTIRRYVAAHVAAPIAAAENIPIASLQQVLETIGAANVPVAEIPERLRQYVDSARQRAAMPVQPADAGADIDAVIRAVRDKLRTLDTAPARDLLQAKIAEEEQARRQRLLPLLKERAAIERLSFDHEAAKATLAEVTRLQPDDLWAWIELGDLWRITGNLEAASQAYSEAGEAARRTGAERDLSVSHDRIGDVKVAQGDRPGALVAYTAGMEIAERLAARDPANTDWQRDLSVSHNKIGDVKVAQGDRPGALVAYTAGMEIAERLAARDPANTDWQRDLSVSHDRIGDVKVAQGDRPGALAAYTAGMEIRERLAARDPANTDWQRDLSVSHDRIGDVKVAQGDRPGALAAYTAGMEIRERLAARDPANTDWQRDLIVSCVKIADTEPKQAVDRLARALEIVRDLAGSGRLAPADAWMPDALEQRLAAVTA